MFRILIFTLCLLAAHAAMADAPPVPGRKTADLPTLQKQLEEQEQNKKLIEQNLKTAERDLGETKKELVKAAETVRDQEKLLLALQQRIDRNTQESGLLKVDLQKDYGAISELLLTFIRLRQLPPEALIVRPGAPLATAQSAMLLKSMLESVNARAAALSDTLTKLHKAQEELNKDRAQALEGRAALESRHAEIAALAKKREGLYKKLNRDYGSSAAAVEKLALEAQNLQDFMTRLEEDRSREQYHEKKQSNRKLPHPPVAAARGTPRAPIYGPITISFGEKDMIGAESKGITIAGEPRAMVVSPMGGTVRFSGNFKEYGPVIIIEHKGQYHSLIIGMDKISVVTEQQLDAGEPVGRLPSASSRGGPPALYYELRHKGQPVDPAGKFTEFKS